MPSRRQFIKSLGFALGAGVLTTAAGGGFKPGKALADPIPNAYAYSRLITTGATLPGGESLSFISGMVTITDHGTVVFHGTDSNGSTGLWEIDIANPSSVRKLVEEGDQLSNGAVDRIITFDTNRLGSTAAVIQHDDGVSGIYMAPQGGDFVSVVQYNQTLPGAAISFGGVFQDIVLHSSDNLSLVGHYNDRDSASTRVGFFNLPQAQANGNGYLLVGSDGLLHGYEGDLANLGLSDVNEKGDYVLQVFGSQSEAVTASSAGGQSSGDLNAMLASGNMFQAQQAGYSTLSWPELPKQGGSPASGNIYMGPRVDSQGSPAYVVHLSDERMSLVIQGTTIISTGDLAPAGWAVQSISPVNPGAGLYFYLLEGYTDQHEFQLMAHNGSESKVLVSMLDTIGDQRIANLVWGMQADQVDSSGRLAFLAEWDDQETQSILLATPA